MNRISIIGSVGIPATYGGFETLIEYLTKEVSSLFDITVYCSGKAYRQKLETHNGAKLKYINLKANGIQSILYDIISLVKALKHSDTILILGVSGCIALPLVKLFSKVKIITNIDGLEWKRDKWNLVIKRFLIYSEYLAVKYSDVVVGDNKVIVDYVKEKYSVDAKLIAYGADHVTKEIITLETISKYRFLDKKYAFKVCRIEPENNVHIILEVFKEYEKLKLVIVGNWANSEYGTKLKEKYKQYNNIFLIDPIYDQQLLNQLRSNCFIYIHGHSAGGTNPSLVEAMYLELPIIAYDVQYNRETTGNLAEYFKNKYELINILEAISEKKITSLKYSIKKYACDNYTWSIIAKKYGQLF